jgi:hypothetical protein
MLRSFGPGASKLLAPEPEAIAELEATLDEGWRSDAESLLAGGWRDQVTVAAAIALGGADEPMLAALWRAVDGSSWVAPQLVAAAALADGAFESRASDRLIDPTRRAPKTIGALVRAYTRSESKRMPVMAQLGMHDRTMATEEARIGVRGVDGWLDYFSSRSSSAR